MTARSLLALLVLSTACDRLTAVEFPDLVQPEQLENATGAAALFAGAQHNFAAAFNGSSGSGSAFVYNTALMSDELRGASGNVIVQSFDTRNLTPTTTTVGDIFAALSRSRVSALAAVHALQVSAATPVSRISQAFSIAAFSELFIAEMYCSGATLTDVVSGQPTTYGEPLTTQQLFERAEDHFDSALATAASDAPSINLAAVGKARALQELGQHDAAAAAVAAVPTNFTSSVAFNATLLPNIWGQIPTGRQATVASGEGTNGLNFRTAGDPRVPTTAQGTGADGSTPIFLPTGLTTASSTVLASGIEARLIEAEAALARGDASWLTTLNNLRATAIIPALAPLADPGTAAGRVDLVFRERAFWLYATGHRLADLRRLVRQYGRAVNATFPTGAYDSARSYVDEPNASLPAQESTRNPNFSGCLDRAA